MSSDQPDLKKQKTAELKDLIPEEEFLQNNPASVVVQLQVPTEEEKTGRQEWSFNGQVLEIPMELTNTIKDLKDVLKEKLGGIPPNKQKLEIRGIGFLKDNPTLAYYNVGPQTTILLGVKARGRGGKK